MFWEMNREMQIFLYIHSNATFSTLKDIKTQLPSIPFCNNTYIILPCNYWATKYLVDLKTHSDVCNFPTKPKISKWWHFANRLFKNDALELHLFCTRSIILFPSHYANLNDFSSINWKILSNNFKFLSANSTEIFYEIPKCDIKNVSI